MNENLTFSRDRVRKSFQGQNGISNDIARYRKQSVIAISSLISSLAQGQRPKQRRSFTRGEKIRNHNRNYDRKQSRSEGSFIVAAQQIKKKSIKVKRQAVISYGNMMLNQRQGDVCITEKCYLLIGIKRDQESLLFNALQGLIDSEREKKLVKKSV